MKAFDDSIIEHYIALPPENTRFFGAPIFGCQSRAALALSSGTGCPGVSGSGAMPSGPRIGVGALGPGAKPKRVAVIGVTASPLSSTARSRPRCGRAARVCLLRGAGERTKFGDAEFLGAGGGGNAGRSQQRFA
jgi:hypothetical protein